MKPFLYALLLLAGLAGCKTPDAPQPVTPDDLTPERKITILDNLQAKMAALNWSSAADAHQQLLSFMKTMPEFEAVGLSDDNSNVWGRFLDEELVIITNSRRRTQAADENEGSSASGRQAGATSTGFGLPTSSKLVLTNAMGNYYTNGKTDMRSLMAIVSGRGYQVDKKPGSIEQLKQVKDAGVFYFSTHGGKGELRDGKQAYALWTTDTVSAKTIKAYSVHFKDKKLCYFLAHNNQDRYGKPIVEKHFGITGKFVQAYMSFAERALLYIDACQSFTDNEFIDIFLQKTGNTGTYLGWTGDVDDLFAAKASKYFFDRTLGANDIYTQPETPVQRPFDPAAVYASMQTKGLTTYTDPDPGRTGAKLTFRSSEDNVTILRPTISYVQVDEEEKELMLFGLFGDDPGAAKRSVTVQGTPLTVKEWSLALITCAISTTGAGSAGAVVVKVGNVESNVRQLTEWRGTLQYRHQTDGSLYENVDLNIHLRADVAKFRTEPGQTPKPITEALSLVPTPTLAQDSYLTYAYGGAGKSQYENCTMEIARQATTGEVKWTKLNIDVTLLDHFQSEMQRTAQGFKFEIDVFKTKAFTYTQTSTCPNSKPAVMNYKDVALSGTRITEFTLVLGSNYDIQAGQVQKTVEGSLLYNAGAVPKFPVTLKWGTLKAQYPPTNTSALRVGLVE